MSDSPATSPNEWNQAEQKPQRVHTPLMTYSEQVKRAVLNQNRLRGHSIQITDPDFAIRQQMKQAWQDSSRSDDIPIDWALLLSNPWFILILAFLLTTIKMC